MNYWKLKHLAKAELRRTVERLRNLRKQLDREIPAKDSEDNLLLATWNLRDFGVPGGAYGMGERLPESLFYIAEILSRFDFVAVQEVNDLHAWNEVMDLLGSRYDFIASDVTEGVSGNGERLTYLYDRRKVSFRNVAGEIVLTPSRLIGKTAKGGKQFARTPYFASFRAGWRRFDICTAHIYYGESSDKSAGMKRRIEEIEKIVGVLAKRADAGAEEGKAMILLGDFNVAGRDHKTMKALQKKGFVVPPAIQEPPKGGRISHYDQIAFKLTKGDALVFPEGSNEEAGSVPLFTYVFTQGQIGDYRPLFAAALKKLNEKERKEAQAKGKAPKLTSAEKFFESWRTWQLSDHRPLWVQLDADDSDEYLAGLLKAG